MCLLVIVVRRYSGGQALPPLRQRVSRSLRDLMHGEDMEAVMADALVSCSCLYILTLHAGCDLQKICMLWYSIIQGGPKNWTILVCNSVHDDIERHNKNNNK